MTAEQTELERIAKRLAPTLEPVGFAFRHDKRGVSSGGPFASGYYVRGPLSLGLIVRRRLGMVTYEANERSIGHDDLMIVLGHENDSEFMFSQTAMEAVGRSGQDPVSALLHDLDRYVRPLLEADDSVLIGLIDAGHRERMRRFRIHDAG